MKNILRTSEIVKELLIEDEKTRDSDDYLYLKVCERINAAALDKPLWFFLANRRTFSIPPFESVRRSRQKLQEHNPELCGSGDVEAQRKVNEEVVRDFARRFSI